MLNLKACNEPFIKIHAVGDYFLAAVGQVRRRRAMVRSGTAAALGTRLLLADDARKKARIATLCARPPAHLTQQPADEPPEIYQVLTKNMTRD